MKKALQFLALTFLIILSVEKMNAQNKHPMKVGMVSIPVSDPAKAFKHYTEVLGFEKVMFEPEQFLAIVKSPAAPDGVTILLEPTELSDIKEVKALKEVIYERGIPWMIFTSDNIEGTVKELKSKGVEFKGEIKETDFGYQTIFDDSMGNYIMLIQYK